MMSPIIEERYWASSQLSVARYYGGCKVNGKDYLIVNKDGITVDELSNPQSKHYVGNGQYAIPPGEPADLVQKDWLQVYKKIGRIRALRLAKKDVSLDEALKMIKALEK